MQLRPASNEPGSHPAFQLPRRVDFLHPGYATRAVLLSLPALDDGGVDFDTALAACGVLAGNRWGDGFFSSDRDGAARVARPGDGVLRDPQYFFHLPGPLHPPYPVVPRFSDWRFPHGNLPPLWEQWASTAVREGGAAASQWCAVTNYGDGLEIAHLVPAAEEDWWLCNGMARYASRHTYSSATIDSRANMLTLRADLHRVFDEKNFCLVPKLESESGTDPPRRDENDAVPEPRSPQLVLHVFNSTPSGQLPKLWHNRVLHPIPATVAVECLFARFAWTIFGSYVFDIFLPETTVPRRLLLWNREEGKWDVEEASPEKYNGEIGLWYDNALGFTKRQEEHEEPRGRSRKRRLSIDAQDYEPSSGPTAVYDGQGSTVMHSSNSTLIHLFKEL
ncbi:hypothetical protein VTH06DRAFT_306 [Thermothelomyces fergusii]